MALSTVFHTIRQIPCRTGAGTLTLNRSNSVLHVNWKNGTWLRSYSASEANHSAKELSKVQIQDVSHPVKTDKQGCTDHKTCDRETVHYANSVKLRNIYTFRYIVHAKVLSRLKIYQTVVTVGSLPLTTYLYKMGMISASGFASFCGIATLATAMLYVMSTFFRRIVGIISVNENEDTVRISHLTFWGRRNNINLFKSDIIPLSELTGSAKDIYQVIRFFEQPDKKFYWFHRHGMNTDPEALTRIFGKL